MFRFAALNDGGMRSPHTGAHRTTTTTTNTPLSTHHTYNTDRNRTRTPPPSRRTLSTSGRRGDQREHDRRTTIDNNPTEHEAHPYEDFANAPETPYHPQPHEITTTETPETEAWSAHRDRAWQPGRTEQLRRGSDHTTASRGYGSSEAPGSWSDSDSESESQSSSDAPRKTRTQHTRKTPKRGRTPASKRRTVRDPSRARYDDHDRLRRRAVREAVKEQEHTPTYSFTPRITKAAMCITSCMEDRQREKDKRDALKHEAKKRLMREDARREQKRVERQKRAGTPRTRHDHNRARQNSAPRGDPRRYTESPELKISPVHSNGNEEVVTPHQRAASRFAFAFNEQGEVDAYRPPSPEQPEYSFKPKISNFAQQFQPSGKSDEWVQRMYYGGVYSKQMRDREVLMERRAEWLEGEQNLREECTFRPRTNHTQTNPPTEVPAYQNLYEKGKRKVEAVRARSTSPRPRPRPSIPSRTRGLSPSALASVNRLYTTKAPPPPSQPPRPKPTGCLKGRWDDLHEEGAVRILRKREDERAQTVHQILPMHDIQDPLEDSQRRMVERLYKVKESPPKQEEEVFPFKPVINNVSGKVKVQAAQSRLRRQSEAGRGSSRAASATPSPAVLSRRSSRTPSPSVAARCVSKPKVWGEGGGGVPIVSANPWLHLVGDATMLSTASHPDNVTFLGESGI